MSPNPTVRAQRQPDPTQALAYIQWDLDNNGSYDLVRLATFLQSGDVILDGVTLPSVLTGLPAPVQLGNGHGTWRFRQQDRMLFVDVLCVGVAIDDGLWFLHIQDNQAPQSNARTAVFKGNATLRRVASIAAFRAGSPPISTHIVKYEWDFDYNAN